MKEQFEFKIIDKSLGGYNSSSDKTNLPAGTLIRGSKNVYRKISGTIATRPGIKRRGTVDATDAPVKSEFVWDTNVGTTRPIRVCNNKLQVESDILSEGEFVWYDLLETSTLAHPAVTLTRFVFDTWWDNTEKTDRLLMVRGDDTILSWSGGIAIVSSVTATTITKQGDETWAELGFATSVAGEKKIVINGIEFTYTGGESTDTLTGITGDTTSLTSGMVVIQSVILSSDKPVDTYKADFLKVIGNQVWVGSYSSRVIYISDSADYDLFTNTGTLVATDPDFILLDNQAKGIGISGDGKVIIFAGDSDLYVVTPNDDLTQVQTFTVPIVGGTGRNVIQRVQKKKMTALSAALGHEFIDNLGEYTVWLDQKNRLRTIGTFSNITTIKPVNLSLPVQTELSEDDFTGGHLKVVGDIEGDTVYITAPNNARDWMYQIREKIDDNGQIITEKIWQPPQIRGISRFSVISGVLYGHSNANPQIYQIWDTDQWFDDHSSEEEIPYVPVVRFAYQNHNRRQGRLIIDIIYIEGYMAEGFDLKSTVYLDYRGASGIRNLSVSNDITLAKFFTGVNAPSLGDSVPGDNPLGDGILEEVGSVGIGGVATASTTFPNITINGESGTFGAITAGNVSVVSGKGGNSFYGVGGAPVEGLSSGLDGKGCGAGGGGSSLTTGSNVNGGAGTVGCVIFTW